MAGAEHDGHRPGNDGTQNRHPLRILAQDFFRDLQHVLQTARRFEYGGTGDDGEDNEHDLNRRLAGRHAQNQHFKKQADTRDDPKTDTAEAAARVKKTDEQDELKNERMLNKKRHIAS